MNAEEFEKGFIERSEITQEFYSEHMVTLPCTCNGEDCEGFAAVSNNELSIKAHNFLYNHEHETYRKPKKPFS